MREAPKAMGETSREAGEAKTVVTWEIRSRITPPARTLVVAGAFAYRRQLGFLRAGASSGGFSWSDSTSEACHVQHLAISSLQPTAGEQTDVTRERNEIVGGRHDISNSHLACAVEYEDEANVEAVEDEAKKTVEDVGGVDSTAQGFYSPSVPRGTPKQHVGGVIGFRTSPLVLPHKDPLLWNSEFLSAQKNKPGQELSHSRRLLDPPLRKTRGGGFPGPRRSRRRAFRDGARLEDVDFGGGALLQSCEKLKRQEREF